jgi:hypothetical protein
VTTLLAYLDPTDVTTAVGNLLGLRPYLGAAASEDTLLTSWYAAAIGWCNEKLSRRDFVVADGFAGDDPPDTVVLGVYEFVRVMRDYSKRPGSGIKKTKTGAREEEYGGDGMAVTTAAGLAAWPYLEPYCEDPTLFASGGA